MSATYTITIKNKSGSSQQYLLFSSVPKVNKVISTDIFTNIYQTAPTVPTGTGTAQFTITSGFYAICGTNPSPLGSQVTITTSDFEQVTLGTSSAPGTSTQVDVTDDAPAFDTSVITAKGSVGGYQIRTGNDFEFPNDNNIFVGLGGPTSDGSGDIMPLATFPAKPGQLYNIEPVVKYYIGTGTYTAGEIINVADVGTTQSIDFTGTHPKSVVVTHNANGTYTVK